MRKTLVILLILGQLSFAAGQSSARSYEVEILRSVNGKDTREVNAVITFENESVIVRSRRTREIIKQFNYADVSLVRHEFSRAAKTRISAGDAAITLMTGIPVFLFRRNKDRNWLTILGSDDFAVLKVENDNFRNLLSEFAVRKIKVVSQSEDTEKELN